MISLASSRNRLAEELRRDPQAVADAAHRRVCEVELIEFVEHCWHVLEPTRAFKRGWALEAICEHLTAVTRGQIRRLIINVPPGLMKSLATNVFWPAWEWGPVNMPSRRHISASYAEALTLRDNLKLRRLIESDHYRAWWGDRFKLTSDQFAKHRFENDKTGFALATSVEGTGTGERGDVFKIDDPHHVKKSDSESTLNSTLQWFTEVVPTRLNDPEFSAIVMIMQRVRENDCSGHALSKELGYEHLSLPMRYEAKYRCFTPVKRADVEPVKVKRVQVTGEPVPIWTEDPEGRALYPQDRRTEEGELLWAERYPAPIVDELEKALSSWGGTYAISGQMQQRPGSRKGGMFQRGDWQFVDRIPEPVIARARGWDLAASDDAGSAFTAGCKMAKGASGRIYIEDVRRLRGTPNQVDDAILQCARQDGSECSIDLPQDPGSSGKVVVHALVAKLAGFRVFWSPESGSKPARARPLSAQAEAKNVYLVRGPWVDEFVAEASLFPGGTYKDQIDAASRTLARIVATPNPTPLVAPEVIS